MPSDPRECEHKRTKRMIERNAGGEVWYDTVCLDCKQIVRPAFVAKPQAEWDALLRDRDRLETRVGELNALAGELAAERDRLAAEVERLRDTWVDPEHAKALGEELTAAVNDLERLRGALEALAAFIRGPGQSWPSAVEQALPADGIAHTREELKQWTRGGRLRRVPIEIVDKLIRLNAKKKKEREALKMKEEATDG